MKKKQQELTYKTRTLNISIQPTCDKDFRVNKKVKVQAPPFTESTYDAGFKVLKELGTTAYAVYMAILSYRNTKTNDCHPSVKRIHEDFNISERTIKDNLDKLYDNGFININSGHKNIASNYYFPKEFYFHAWDGDFNQDHAERRKNGISEDRRTKKEILEELNKVKEENEKLKRDKNNNDDYEYEDDDNWDDLPF